MGHKGAWFSARGVLIFLFLFLYIPAQLAGNAYGAAATGPEGEAGIQSGAQGRISDSLSNPFVLKKGNLYFLDDADSACLVSGRAKAKRLVIPARISVAGKRYRVERIAQGAFAGNRRLQKVLGGRSITAIGKRAFAGCSALKVVRGFASLVSMDREAFMNCKKLKEFEVGSGLSLIGDRAFSGCRSLESLFLGASLAGIGKKAFYGCSALKKLEIASVYLTNHNIGEKAFKGLPASCTVKVPANHLGDYQGLFQSRGLSTKARFKKR